MGRFLRQKKLFHSSFEKTASAWHFDIAEKVKKSKSKSQSVARQAMEYTLVPGKGGRTVYKVNNGLFHKDRIRGTRIYARCHRFRAGCPVRVVLDGASTTVFSSTGEHEGDHSDDYVEVLLRDFRQRLKALSEDCSTGLLKECYDRAAEEMPEAATHLTYIQVSWAMSAWRRSKWPRNPASAQDALRIFEAASTEDAPFARFFYCEGESANGVFLLFVNTSNAVMDKLASTSAVLADATFRTAPKFWSLARFG